MTDFKKGKTVKFIQLLKKYISVADNSIHCTFIFEIERTSAAE